MFTLESCCWGSVCFRCDFLAYKETPILNKLDIVWSSGVLAVVGLLLFKSLPPVLHPSAEQFIFGRKARNVLLQ